MAAKTGASKIINSTVSAVQNPPVREWLVLFPDSPGVVSMLSQNKSYRVGDLGHLIDGYSETSHYLPFYIQKSKVQATQLPSIDDLHMQCAIILLISGEQLSRRLEIRPRHSPNFVRLHNEGWVSWAGTYDIFSAFIICLQLCMN
jgi:hypothetical protein